MSTPDFIGIGAARSGSTWLSSQLLKHPNVWIPRRKELHYFTRDPSYLSPSYLQDSSWLQRLFSMSDQFKRYRESLARALARNVLHPNLAQLSWDLKYYFSMPNDQWYRSLFTGHEGKITGEITPAYALLSDEDASNLVKQLPDIKVFYIVRDPIERAWSTIRYHEKRYEQKLTDMPVQEIKEYLSNSAIANRSDYDAVIERWSKILPEDQFLVLWYDQIIEEPNKIRHQLYDFLNMEHGLVEEIVENKQVKRVYRQDASC